MAYDDDPIFHGVDEVVVKYIFPDCLYELTSTVSHNLASLGVPVRVPA